MAVTRDDLRMLVRDYGDMERALGAASVGDGYKSREWYARDFARGDAQRELTRAIDDLFDEMASSTADLKGNSRNGKPTRRR